MKKEIILGVDAKYYNYIEKLWDSVATLYNYSYLKTFISIKDTLNSQELKDKDKVYFEAENKLGLVNRGNNLLNYVEVISLAYRLLEEMGLDDVLVVVDAKDTKKLDDMLNYLGLLDVDYELEKVKENDLFTNLVFNIINDKNEVLVEGGEIKDGYALVIDLEKVVLELKKQEDKRLIQDTLDVNVLADNLEEKMVGMRLVQDLRWSDIKSDMGTFEARITVKLDKDKLNKGLMEVKDNLTGDTTDVDENEILEYLISNL